MKRSRLFDFEGLRGREMPKITWNQVVERYMRESELAEAVVVVIVGQTILSIQHE